MNLRRVCVYGAGAIGGNLAAMIASSGAEVSVVVRGANLAAIRKNGLRVETAQGTVTAKVAASDDPAELGVQDLVIVTTKTPALPDVAHGIAPLLGPETPVVFAINGIPWWYGDGLTGPYVGLSLPQLDQGGVLHDRVGTARTLGGVVYAASSVIEPGVVRVSSKHNRLIVGEIDHRVTPRAEAIVALLKAGGVEGVVSADIRSDVWTKLIINLGNGPASVLSGSAISLLIAQPAIENSIRAVCAEAMQVAEKLGHTSSVDVEAYIANSRNLAHKPSILQDLELGRRMEVATLYEATLTLARLAGVETPVLDLLISLVVLRAKSAGLYG